MDRKPTSISEFLKTVLFVKNPDLLDVDKIILLAMAIFADANTGGNSFIGIDNLCQITGRSRRAIKYRLRQLEAAKLVECTAYAKGGRGHAAVYRLCLEHRAYQPFVPKGGKHGCPLCGDKQCKQDCPLSKPIPTETGQSSPVKGEPEAAKGGNEARKGGNLDCPPSKAIQRTPTHHPNPEGWLATKSISGVVPTDYERHEVEKLIAEFGLPVVQVMLREFENRDKGFRGVDAPWRLFLKEYPALAAPAKEEVWKASPEYKAQQEHFEIQVSTLLNSFDPLPELDWPHMAEEERALLQKAKAGDPYKLFLSREELHRLGDLKHRYSVWQGEQEKNEMLPADLFD